jgi:serine/threonine protein phosphatase PrpC
VLALTLAVAVVRQPDVADEYDVEVRAGDLVLLATDGVWDNVDVDEVVGLVNENLQLQLLASFHSGLAIPEIGRTAPPEVRSCSTGDAGATALSQCAMAIAARAVQASESQAPKERAARPDRFNGRKPDDITVVVGFVSAKGS